MKKELSNCVKWTDKVISDYKNVDMEKSCTNLSRWISYFQHERLVHLIVTALFALITMICFFASVVTEKPLVILLFAIVLILTLAYVAYYFYLENTTQLLYHKMDKFIELKEEKNELR